MQASQWRRVRRCPELATGRISRAGENGEQGEQGPTGASGGITWSVTNNGSGAYTINGSDNPTLSVIRGHRYIINLNATGHPFYIQTVSGAYSSGNEYTTGISGDGLGTDVGTIIWEVPYDAPDNLYYVCQFHSSMQGSITVSDLGPQGDQGEQGIPGTAATVSVGTVTTGNPGTSASITNSGNTSAAVFDFTIPKGDTGPAAYSGSDPVSVTSNNIALSGGYAVKIGDATNPYPIIYIGTQPSSPTDGDIWISF